MDAAELAQRENALKLSRAQRAEENAALARDMADLVKQPAFERRMLAEGGYLAEAEKEALNVLADAVATPVTNHITLAVHLSRWRDLRAMRADLSAMGTLPRP